VFLVEVKSFSGILELEILLESGSILVVLDSLLFLIILILQLLNLILRFSLEF
jgi:hypothetical protein